MRFMGRVPGTLDDPRSRKRRCIRNLGMASLSLLLAGILAWKLCHLKRSPAIPALAKQWHEQLYSLDEDETVRFVPPPYTPERTSLPWAKAQRQLGFVVYDQNRIYSIARQSYAPWEG